MSTDSAHIAKEARMSGADVHWRSSESATDTAPAIVGVQEFCSFHQGLCYNLFLWTGVVW